MKYEHLIIYCAVLGITAFMTTVIGLMWLLP